MAFGGTGGEDRVAMSFLFTDIVGSTRMWEQYPAAMPEAVARHDRLVDEVVSDHGGRVFHRAGDGVIASFPDVVAAVRAAAEGQRRFAAEDWDAVGGLAVRMGVHHGMVVLRDGEPYGWALNFGARFSAAGQGGQILLSEPVAEELAKQPPEPFAIEVLGTQRLRDIARPARLFQLLGPGLQREFAPLRDLLQPAPLPSAPDSMIDRVEDLSELERSLGSHRLVTLLGPPGVGKSRVAVEAANRRLASAGIAVRRCDLAGAAGGQIVDAIATSLGVSTRPGRTAQQSLVEWLDDQQLLLVLDHCERSIEEAAGVVRSILDATSGTVVLCTSHRPLGIEGEYLYRLGPLAPQHAVALFVDRAPAVEGTFGDTPLVRELCEQLDRLPFAIEVAAAHSPLYPIEELTRILGAQGRTDASGPGAELQSLYDALALGYDALPEELRAALIAATAFAGLFDRAGFAAVCCPTSSEAQAVAALTELVNRSLVSAEPAQGGAVFRLLRGVHEFVSGRADPDERRAADERLEQWVAAFIAEAAGGLRGPDEVAWHRRVAQQFDNVRAVFTRAVDAGDLARSAEVGTVLWDYAFMRFNDEYFRWTERVLDEFPDGDERLLAPVFGVAALGAWFRDDLDVALERANRAIELEREHDLEFDLPARLAVINASVYSGATAPPPDVYEDAAEYQRSRSELYFEVNVIAQNSIMATWQGDTVAAVRRGIRAVRMARESGNPSSLSFALWALGSALEADDPLQAENLLGDSLAVARDSENRWVTALVQMSLASLRRRTGGAIDAAPILLDLLVLLSRAGHRSHLWHALRLCALVLGDLGDDDLAIQLSAWVRDARLAMPPLPVDEQALRDQHERIRAERGDEWIARTELMTATWTTGTAATVVRAALVRHLDAVGAEAVSRGTGPRSRRR